MRTKTMLWEAKEHRIARMMVLIGVLAALILCFLSSTSLAKEMDDSRITLAVERALYVDQGVASHLIDVITLDGIVTLTGSVNNVLSKDRATKVAESVKGVRSVVNRMTVRPVDRSDEDIEKDVRQALVYDPATDSYEVDVSVIDGVVTLNGTVDSWQEKQLCALVAKGVKGVRDLRNDIIAYYKEARPDREIKAEVESRLKWDVWVDDLLIDVEVKDGHVALSGTVGSAAEETWAYGDAWVNGVKSVDTSDLKVDPVMKDKMRREKKYTKKPDSEIEKAIKDAFLCDPRVFSFNPDVDVHAGVATLTGVVDNLKAKQAAEQDAKNTFGVWRVKNYLRVRPVSRPRDSVLVNRVKEALALDPYVERYEVNVAVVNAKAYLYGSVDSAFEKAQAEAVAAGVKGVVDVQNDLIVPEIWLWGKADWEIKQDIQDELWWSPYVDSEEITVTVRDGVATLTGVVDTWKERGAATDNAYEGGAKKVQNELTVRHGPAFFAP
jgi:osmotically-inducible protein OsmY